jgi:micrococcal nuclease
MIALAALLLMCTAIDGDGLRCPEIGAVRIVNIDAPELFKPQCEYERRLAIKARDYVAEFLREPVEIIVATERKTWGRTLAYVRRGGADLGEDLVSRGLARVWTGRRESWCTP